MNLLAIMGSPRKGKATDVLIDKAIEGVIAKNRNIKVKKICLIDHNINYCSNCLSCRERRTERPIAKCTIRDDIDVISADIIESDLLIFGTPLHMGYPTAVMMTFLGRICWTFAKPERRILTLSNCPMPRSGKKRKSVTIITSGIIPPMFRRFSDNAASLIKTIAADSLNAQTVGDLYAGNIEHKGIKSYYRRAFVLGKRLKSPFPFR